MNFIAFFRELIQRFATESPDFYKKLQWWVGGFTAVLGLALAGDAAFDWGFGGVCFLNMPLDVIINYVIVFLVGVFGLSLTPVKNPDKLK